VQALGALKGICGVLDGTERGFGGSWTFVVADHYHGQNRVEEFLSMCQRTDHRGFLEGFWEHVRKIAGRAFARPVKN
jgi:hypothetical protein